ncbi:hypothetical protein TrRE_jg4708 [Triparma retinervis]|uniref:Uncharacterized protein n=1 Tax=Triparma retinervis TaxID=2557542 RepID=A0A9W7ANB8_9STRA|nr:hypothetical protein TrRE_jg4708 [Triparma retinervis]
MLDPVTGAEIPADPNLDAAVFGDTLDGFDGFDGTEMDILASLLDTVDVDLSNDAPIEAGPRPPNPLKQRDWKFTPTGPPSCIPCEDFEMVSDNGEDDDDGDDGVLPLRRYADLSETVMCKGSDINRSPSIIVLCEMADDDEQKEIINVLKEVSENQPEDSDLLFFYGTRSMGPVLQIREVCELPVSKHEIVLLKLDIPSYWTFYISDVTDITVETVSTFITESLQLDAKQPYGYQGPPPPPAPRPSSRDWKFNPSGPATCLPCDDPNQTYYEPPPPPSGGSSHKKTRAEIDADEIFSDSTKPSEPTSAEDRAELKYLRARVETLEAELAEARSAGGVDKVVYSQEEPLSQPHQAPSSPPPTPSLLLSNLRSSLASEPKLILGPKVPTFSLAYSKPYLASGGEDGYVYIFDESNHFKIVTRRKCEVAEGPKKGGSTEFEVLRVAWGPDGRTLFVGTASGLVEVLLLREGGSGGEGEGEGEPPKAVRSLPLGMTSKACQPCDTPDPNKKGTVNLMLVGKLDHTVDENGQLKEMKDELAPQVYGICSVGPNLVAVATDDEVTVWSVPTSSRSFSFNFRRIGSGKTGGGRNPNDIVYVFGMDWSAARGELALALSDGTCRVMNLKGELRSVLSLPVESIRATNCKWSDKGQRLTTSFSSGHVALWGLDGASGKPRCLGLYGGVGICYGATTFPPDAPEVMGEAVLSYGKGGRVWAFDSRFAAGDPVAWTGREGGEGEEVFDVESWWTETGVTIAVGGRREEGAIGVPILLYKIDVTR